SSGIGTPAPCSTDSKRPRAEVPESSAAPGQCSEPPRLSAPRPEKPGTCHCSVAAVLCSAFCRGSAVLSAVVPPALTCGFTPRHGVTALLHPLVEKLTVAQERPSFSARIVL